ncbi:hypothetical protein Trydic_g11629 [Trypoxylus dichotomus]
MVSLSEAEHQLSKNHSRRKKVSNMKDIHLGETLIESKSEVIYLGITLDKTLLWNRHIALTNKTTRGLMVCRNLAGKTWGCYNILRWLYISIVRPIVTYGAVTWFQKVTQVTTRNTLDKLQHENIPNRGPGGHLRPHTLIYISVERVAHAAMYRLTRAGTEGNKTPCQRTWSSRAKFSLLLSLPNDEMCPRFYIIKKNGKDVVSQEFQGVKGDVMTFEESAYAVQG